MSLIKYCCGFFSLVLGHRKEMIIISLLLLHITLKGQHEENTVTYQVVSTSDLTVGMKVIRRLKEGKVIVARPSLIDHGLAQPDENWKWISDQQPDDNRTLYLASLLPEVTQEKLKELGYSYSRYGASLLSVNVGPNVDIASWEEVYYIGYEDPTAKTEAVVLDLNLNPNGFNLMKQEFPDISGADQAVSLQELRFRSDDIDLLGRTVYPDFADSRESEHATQMATIIGGAGNSLITGLGILPEVILISSGFDQPIPDLSENYENFDIRVQNHSYGTTIESFYGAYAHLFDQSANENPSLLHVFSSGNEGNEVASDGTYANIPGYGNLTGNYKMAKNAIVVGAVDTIGRVETFVSNGPAYDGRVKPEIVAYSTSGSSNSAAMVSGLTAAIQQLYERLNLESPSSALVKSVLINGAQDVGRQGVDFRTGYGNVDAAESMRTIRDSRFILGNLTMDRTDEYDLEIPANARAFKATIVWNDPAANPGDEVALVNDLDLKMISNEGEEFLPWVLDANPSLQNLESLAARGEDHLNNVEQISVTDLRGAIKLQVASTSQVSDQAYAIAYTWELEDQFEWRFPLASNNMPYNGETDGYFRWKSTFEADEAQLEITYDQGLTWEVIDSGVDLNRGYYRWKAPDTVTTAIARMRFDQEQFETDLFTVANITRPSVGFDCGDSLLLQWPQAEAAEFYRLFQLGSTAMEPIADLRDTLALIRDEDVNTGIYAVQPVLASDIPLIRSEAFDVRLLSGGCYFSSFFAETLPDEGILLNVQLGALYHVDQLVFQRFVEDDFTTIGTMEPDREITGFIDDSPNQGYNLHRIGVTFNDGRTLFSDSITTYFLTSRKLLVFPNPVQEGNALNVFTRILEDEDAPVFELMNAQGKVFVRQAIRLENESIDLSDLQSGLYFYRVTGLGGDVSGRVVIR